MIRNDIIYDYSDLRNEFENILYDLENIQNNINFIMRDHISKEYEETIDCIVEAINLIDELDEDDLKSVFDEDE